MDFTSTGEGHLSDTEVLALTEAMSTMLQMVVDKWSGKCMNGCVRFVSATAKPDTTRHQNSSYEVLRSVGGLHLRFIRLLQR